MLGLLLAVLLASASLASSLACKSAASSPAPSGSAASSPAPSDSAVTEPEPSDLVVSGSGASDIQRTIDSCPAGGTVTIPAGTYTITSPISVKSGVTLKGEGVDRTILTMPEQPVPTALIEGDGISGVAVSDMTLASPDAGGYVFALWFSRYSGVTIERVKVLDCQYALKADTQGSDLTVRDFTARACGQIYISNLTTGLFERLDLEMVTQRISDTFFHPLYVSENCDHLRFYDVRAVGGSGHAVQIWGGVATDVLFDGLHVENDYAIVIGAGADGVTLRNATVIKTGEADAGCVELDHPKNILVEDFTCTGGSALMSTYADSPLRPENVTFRNGVYNGPKLYEDWGVPITNLVFENVTLSPAS